MGRSSVLLVVAFSLLAVAYALVVPLGEAPDEPAHFGYLQHLIGARRLPSLEGTYEAHQPPGAYVVSAGLLAATGVRTLTPVWSENPDFDFRQPPRRRVLGVGPPEEASKLRRARLLNLGWAAGVAAGVLLAARRLAGDEPTAVAAAAPFLLSPQVLFTVSTYGNDGAVVAASSLALAGLLRLAGEPDEPATRAPSAPLEPVPAALGRSLPALVGLAAGAALWLKVSALYLALPMGIVAGAWLRRRRVADAARLVGPFVGLLALLLAFHRLRFGAWWPPVLPLGWGSNDMQLARLVLEPGWMRSLWGSYWASLGWLNVRLPVFAYGWFLLPTAAAAAGGLRALGDRRLSRLVAAGAAVGNLALLLVYLATADWQPQGRYLFPSLAAAVGLAALGLPRRWRGSPPLAALSLAGSLAIAVAGLLVLRWAYA